MRLLAGCLVFCAYAQDAKFSADVKLVTLLASVRGRDGNIVKDLNQDDFTLTEDGRPQTIRYFSRESDLPLTIGLLIDTSRSMQPVFAPECAASRKFLEQVLREDRDQAFVMHFDVRVGLLQGLTPSREKLAEALDQLKIPKLFGTKLYNSIRRASEDVMMKPAGRKAYVLLSDGKDVGSQTSIVTAIEFAQRADTMIHAILYGTTEPGGRRRPVRRVVGRDPSRGPKVMARLARETGGGFFEVTEENPIDKIYAQIEEELRNQYSIAYRSDAPESNGKYRKIVLTAKRKGLVVHTRDGYYPK